MISVITGDIVHSRSLKNPSIWIEPLKKLLAEWGECPKDWDIYRGDSFQLRLHDPANTFEVAVRIKAHLKAFANVNVRIAVGIGEQNYHAERVTEANGTAFIYSGELYEKFKNNQLTLAIKTPWIEFDEELNLYFRLVLLTMDNWTQAIAEIVCLLIQNKQDGQEKIATPLHLTQASVSARIKRSHWNLIEQVDDIYRKKLHARLN